jgi:hypothetical protein
LFGQIITATISSLRISFLPKSNPYSLFAALVALTFKKGMALFVVINVITLYRNAVEQKESGSITYRFLFIFQHFSKYL